MMQTLLLSLGRTANCQTNPIHRFQNGLSMSTLSRIQEHIPTSPVVVVSKSYCPFCNRAKDVLKSFDLGNDMEVYEIDNDPEMNKIQDFMAKSTGARSVPRIFIGGQFVGGCDELMKLKSSGKLGQLISSARSG